MHVLIKIKLQVYYEIDLLTFVYNRDCVNMFCKQYKEGRKGSKLISKVATCWTSISCKQLNVIVVVVLRFYGLVRQPDVVISSAVSLLNHTFTGQA